MNWSLVLFYFSSLKVNAATVNSSSDFQQVVGSPFFTDKSMLAFEVLNDYPNLLSVPRKFGTSTNIDMLRRFLQIQVDEAGEPQHRKQNANYDLFVRHKLEITKNKTWFDEHFASYPVIQLDYNSLVVDSFDEMLSSVERMVRDVFKEHAYLVNSSKLWENEESKQEFTVYIQDDYSQRLSKAYIKAYLTHGLQTLSKLMSEHFGRNIVILIDNYDAWLYRLPTNRALDTEEIIDFITTMNSMFLQNSPYIDYGLMVNCIPKEKRALPKYLFKNCVLFCRVFNKYFGLTTSEVDKLIPKVVEDGEERAKLRHDFEATAAQVASGVREHQVWRFYGYINVPDFYKLYSFEPLLKFVTNETNL